MEEILHHLGWLKPYKQLDKPPFSTGAGFRHHPPLDLLLTWQTIADPPISHVNRLIVWSDDLKVGHHLDDIFPGT